MLSYPPPALKLSIFYPKKMKLFKEDASKIYIVVYNNNN